MSLILIGTRRNLMQITVRAERVKEVLKFSRVQSLLGIEPSV